MPMPPARPIGHPSRSRSFWQAALLSTQRILKNKVRIEDKALARSAQRENTKKLPIAAGSSALDRKREPGPRRSGVAEQLSVAGGPSAIDGKCESGPRPLLVVEGISALSDKSEPGPRPLPMVESISALKDKNELGPRQLPVV